MRAVALVLTLGFAAGGCSGGDGQTTGETEAVAVSFESYQCQTVIQASAQVRRAVQADEAELLAHLIGLAQFYETSGSRLPEDLREDFDTLLEPYDAYWSAVSLDFGGATPPPEFLQPVLDDIDQPEFLAAATRVNTWANEDC